MLFMLDLALGCSTVTSGLNHVSHSCFHLQAEQNLLDLRRSVRQVSS